MDATAEGDKTIRYKNQCLTPSMIYRTDVENNANEDTKIYIGLAERSFKERFRNHK